MASIVWAWRWVLNPRPQVPHWWGFGTPRLGAFFCCGCSYKLVTTFFHGIYDLWIKILTVVESILVVDAAGTGVCLIWKMQVLSIWIFWLVWADIIRYLLGQSFLSKFCYCFTLEHSYRFRDAPEIRLFIPQPVVLLVELAKVLQW